MSVIRPSGLWRRWQHLLSIVGPGVMVMLADNDAGSIITVTQSGAQWGYRLLLLQVLIVPVLFMVQELSARIGLATGLGLGELVRRRLGPWSYRLCSLGLLISCFGALVTQIGGMAELAQLFGIPPWLAATLPALLIFGLFVTGSYRSVEHIAIACGVFGLAFWLVAWRARPDLAQIGAQLFDMPVRQPAYLYLVAANLGTSIMPWTVFYQQSALVDQGLGLADLRTARLDTLIGALLCQLTTIAVLLAAAAALGGSAGSTALDHIAQIAAAFSRYLGPDTGRKVFAIGFFGCALVATIVICLTAAWAVGEAAGKRHALEHHPTEVPGLYLTFGALLIGAVGLVGSGTDTIRLSIAAGTANALLLPLVLWLLHRLATRELPASVALTGRYRRVVEIVFIATALLALLSGLAGSLG